MHFKTLKEAEDFYYANLAQTNDEEPKLESWLAEQEIEETEDKSTIMEEFSGIEQATKDLAREAGIVYPSSVFENDAEDLTPENAGPAIERIAAQLEKNRVFDNQAEEDLEALKAKGDE